MRIPGQWVIRSGGGAGEVEELSAEGEEREEVSERIGRGSSAQTRSSMRWAVRFVRSASRWRET